VVSVHEAHSFFKVPSQGPVQDIRGQGRKEALWEFRGAMWANQGTWVSADRAWAQAQGIT
jgi:hypothetical protein